tara:strand:- start:8103 stop:9116 length:1014 start_codon:yes stop_codon:yes gene_type:complete
MTFTNEVIVTPAEVGGASAPALLERSSWASVLLGAVIAFGILTVLNLIGLAFGLYMIDTDAANFGLAGAGWVAGLWWVASSLVALFVGGWVAARMAGIPNQTSAAIHGATVWALTTLLAVWMVSSAASTAFTGVAGLAGRTAQLSVAGVQASAGLVRPAVTIAADSLTTELRQQGATVDPAQVRQSVEAVINRSISPAERQQLETLATRNAAQALQAPSTAQTQYREFANQAFGPNGVIGTEDREQAIAALSNELGVPEPQVRQAVANWETQISAMGDRLQNEAQQLQTVATERAEQAANAVADTALWTALGLIVALGAAVLGGVIGRPRYAAVLPD